MSEDRTFWERLRRYAMKNKENRLRFCAISESAPGFSIEELLAQAAGLYLQLPQSPFLL